MTTIILTIIGILLAAAAALMVIFYGGDAFNSGSVGAQANTLQNAGTNVIAAVQLYRADTGVEPKAEADLTTAGPSGTYLKEAPALPTAATPSYQTDVGVTKLISYHVGNVDTAVCARVNKNLKLTGTVTLDSGKMGCAGGVFFASL